MANTGKAAVKDEPAKKRCFVIGPIGAANSPMRIHADWLLEGIIQPAFEESFPDFKVDRSDRITEPGMIDSQMINLLIEAELVIADMSHLNANAFYEMGIRHMAQKPIIHMFLQGSEIPFDVKPYRAIPFSVAHPKDLISARRDLIAAINDATSENHKIDNPVTRARGQAVFEQTATPHEKVILDEVRFLRQKFIEFERESLESSIKGSRRVPLKVYRQGRQCTLMIKLQQYAQNDIATQANEISKIQKYISEYSEDIEQVKVDDYYLFSFNFKGSDKVDINVLKNMLLMNRAVAELREIYEDS